MERSKTDNELIQKTDIAIAELVYDKDELQKAYNYYNCKRDAEQFRYLEENFGIGNPTSVEFTPLIRKHVDALIGEYLGTPILPKISCKDTRTISAMTREKELHISREVYKQVQKNLKNKLLDFMETGDSGKLVDPYIHAQLDTLIEDLNNNFISQYEIAAQNVLQYIMQNRKTDFKTKLWALLKDLLVTGYTFYQAVPTAEGNNVSIDVLDPLNTFIDKNPNSPYVKDSYRVVVRKWMTKSQILNKYGREMSKEDIQNLKEQWKEALDYSAKYIRLMHTSNSCGSYGIVGDHEAVVEPGKPRQKNKGYNPNYEQIPVYEVEWIETDKNFVMQLYQTVRIGQDIYILRGKKEDVIRSADNPSYCGLTVNGVYFDNRNDEPFSLVLACANEQDRYDLFCYFNHYIATLNKAKYVFDFYGNNFNILGELMVKPIVEGAESADYVYCTANNYNAQNKNYKLILPTVDITTPTDDPEVIAYKKYYRTYNHYLGISENTTDTGETSNEVYSYASKNTLFLRLKEYDNDDCALAHIDKYDALKEGQKLVPGFTVEAPRDKRPFSNRICGWDITE